MVGQPSLGDVPDELAAGLEDAIRDALADVEPELRRAALDGLIGSGDIPAEPDPRAMRAFELYHGQSLDGLNLVNSTLRTAAPAKRVGGSAARNLRFPARAGRGCRVAHLISN